MIKIVFATLAVLALASAGPHGGQGPFGQLFNNLTSAQQDQLKQVFQNNQNGTVGQFKTALQTFVSTLPAATQEAFNQQKTHMESWKTQNDQKAATLGSAAQGIYNQIKDISNNDGLTRQQQQDQIKQVFTSADSNGLSELKNSGIRLPGRHGHGSNENSQE